MSHHFTVVFDISDEDYCSSKTILMALLESRTIESNIRKRKEGCIFTTSLLFLSLAIKIGFTRFRQHNKKTLFLQKNKEIFGVK